MTKSQIRTAIMAYGAATSLAGITRAAKPIVFIEDDPLANATTTVTTPVVLESPPPSRLAIDPNHPDHHPSYQRVGVRVDGSERNDLTWYDLAQKLYSTRAKARIQAETLEPYWRYPESRQQRRARERWEAKR